MVKFWLKSSVFGCLQVLGSITVASPQLSSVQLGSCLFHDKVDSACGGVWVFGPYGTDPEVWWRVAWGRCLVFSRRIL